MFLVCSGDMCIMCSIPVCVCVSQEVFPVQYGAQYDTALKELMWDLLSRLEKLFPVPDLNKVRYSVLRYFALVRFCVSVVSLSLTVQTHRLYRGSLLPPLVWKTTCRPIQMTCTLFCSSTNCSEVQKLKAGRKAPNRVSEPTGRLIMIDEECTR